MRGPIATRARPPARTEAHRKVRTVASRESADLEIANPGKLLRARADAERPSLRLLLRPKPAGLAEAPGLRETHSKAEMTERLRAQPEAETDLRHAALRGHRGWRAVYAPAHRRASPDPFPEALTAGRSGNPEKGGRFLRRHQLLAFAAVSTIAVAPVYAASGAALQPPVWAAQPDAAAFEKLEEARLADAQRAIDRLLAGPSQKTIANTLAPYDEAVEEIDAASYLAGLMQQVHPDVTFRDRATRMMTKTAAAQSALSLNRGVYDALRQLNAGAALGNAAHNSAGAAATMDPATRHYLRRTLLEFRLAGVDKDDAVRAQLQQLNRQLAEEQSAFDRNISDDPRSIEVQSVADLDGLPADYIRRHPPGADGRIRITTSYPDALPAFQFARSADLRRRLWIAFHNRAYPRNREVLMQMMQTRYRIATLLGWPSWADYNAADKMIGRGGNIAAFISQIDAASRPVAERELAMLLAEKRKTDPQATRIWDYEGAYFQEQVRRSHYDFNSQSVRPYFPYDQVKQGVLDAAAELFHVTFRREPNVPAWAPSVETWLVLDHGRVIGRFYLDMHPRPGKYTHAEMAPLLDGVRGRQLPEAVLVCNLPQPTANDPGLMDFDDVQTFFHEFGHLMHHILGGQQQWAGISGISMEADFVEAPSQMLEEWIRSPQTLAKFARNYKTGAPIPAELVARMNRAMAFGRGEWVARQNSLSALSYDVYRSDPKTVDLDAVCLRDAKRYTLFSPLPGSHEYASFPHLAGYSSAYYTYLWDKVIALDFFSQFDRNNLLAGSAPMRYRRLVLEPGGSMPANELVRNFLGRPQNTKALRAWMSEEFDPAPGER